jgi:hypothetical protein
MPAAIRPASARRFFFFDNGFLLARSFAPRYILFLGPYESAPSCAPGRFMNPPCGWRLVRHPAGAAFALLAGLLLPSSAWAGCGEYPAHLPLPAAAAQGMLPGLAGKMMHHTPARSGDHRGPCHGPNCSRNSAPLQAPVPPAPERVEQWGCLAGLVHLSSVLGTPSAADGRHPCPAGFGMSIYHPPR